MLTYGSIISAGAIHTPQILQRSGIGPADLLGRAGIEVISDLPGVGYNFHDHGGPRFGVNSTSCRLDPEYGTCWIINLD